MAELGREPGAKTKTPGRVQKGLAASFEPPMPEDHPASAFSDKLEPQVLGLGQGSLPGRQSASEAFLKLHRLAGEEVGIGQELFELGNLGGQAVDLGRQFVEPVLLGKATARISAWAPRRLVSRPLSAQRPRRMVGAMSRPRWGAIIAPAAGIDSGPAVALHRDGCRRHAVKEIPVVADEQNGSVIVTQQVLQQIERFDIEIVCRARPAPAGSIRAP